ncbi:GNAT family N-acetyltransferase [Planomonospora sp. ID91781]|uniref:GNAT family N-acetyltransferase n=1 Tax=Planomonospora sp. ID91781 TaxID=2738135 RepID=UPI0018C40712|nr:GNAT family N-acetyltransferase [Planomonospora sp. ID91781]MBG0825084.1 GNAT family N-acetyltransferase [Planomonospora sp. ID91781]
MKITVVCPGELGEPEINRWREIQKASPALDNPFLSVDFTLAMGRLRDRVRVAVIEDGGTVTGFFPYERHAFGVGRPLGGFLVTCHGVIATPEFKMDARELLRACRLSVIDFDYLVAGQPTFSPYETDVRPAPVMDLGSGFDAYVEQIRAASPKNYKTVRYKERKLGREHGEVRFDWESADLGALHTLLRWKSDQYQRTGRVDRFAQPWIIRLVEEMHAARSDDFAGVLTMVYAGDTPVAGHFGLRTAQTLVGWFPAYDTAYAPYSPGIMHHLHLAEHAARAGLHQIDMGKGDREYKDWLKTGVLMVAEARVARPSPTTAVQWAGRVPLSRLRTAVVDDPRLFKAADRLLKAYGQAKSRLRPRFRSHQSTRTR